MKLFIAVTVLALSFFSVAVSAADVPTTVELQTPEGFASKICPSQKWKNIPFVWEGVTDSREDKAVGSQVTGSKEPIDITPVPPLESVLDKAIPELLEACGMKQVKKSDENAARIAVEVESFHAGVTKTLFTGKGTAESWFKITVRKGPSTETAKFGYEMESKGMRSGKIKQLKKTLDDLLFQTLSELPKADPIKSLK